MRTNGCAVALVVCAVSLTSVDAYDLGNRWSRTASGNPGDHGDPIVLTYSFMPDGTPVPQKYSGIGGACEPLVQPQESVLFATLDAQFGDEATWKPLFHDALQRWTDVSGITFIEEVDDGALAHRDSLGRPGVRGDIRIGAVNLTCGAGAGFKPNDGDLYLDSQTTFTDPRRDFRFIRNIIAHELGHVLGLDHTYPRDDSKLMETILPDTFTGPQDDDIRGIDLLYGDRYESNDVSADAANLGTLLGNRKLKGSLDVVGGEDWFAFELATGGSVSAELLPEGTEYLLDWADYNAVSISRGGSVLGVVDRDRRRFLLLDLNEPFRPRIASITDIGAPRVVALDGVVAYVGDDRSGLLAIDIGDPELPRVVGSLAATASTHQSVVAGGYLYTSGGSRVRIIDVQDPMAMAEISTIYTSSRIPQDWHLVGGHIYSAEGSNGLAVYDVNDVNDPALVAQRGGDARGVRVAGTTAYVTGNTGLRMYDVTDPSSPTPVGTIDLPGAGGKIEISGTRAFIARGNGPELWIVDLPTGTVSATVDLQINLAQDTVLLGSYVYLSGSGSGGVGGVNVAYVGMLTPPNLIADDARIDTRRAQNLDLEIWNADATRLIASRSTGGIGDAERLPSISLSAGTYLARVRSEEGWESEDGVQRYGLVLGATPLLPSSGEAAGRTGLSVSRSPSGSGAVVRLWTDGSTTAEVRLLDVRGRLVRRYDIDVNPAEGAEVVWDGLDAGARTAAPGVYFVQATFGGRLRSTRFVHLAGH